MAPELARQLCLIRGGGDLATGVAWRLNRAGFPVVVTELAAPLAVRRTVALSTAIDDGSIDIEGMIGKRVASLDEAIAVTSAGEVAVIVSPELPPIGASVVVDARLAKRNIDTTVEDAGLVIGLGPGFNAGEDCHVVIETMRGPRLGRAIWHGTPAADTGIPDQVQGRGAERVLRAPARGELVWSKTIGDRVGDGDELGSVGGQVIVAPFDGLIRGLIRTSQSVELGDKVGDVDPRAGASYLEISDKALAIGGGVVEAVLTWQMRSN